MHISRTAAPLLALSTTATAIPRFWKPGPSSDSGQLTERGPLCQDCFYSTGVEYVTIEGFTAPILTSWLVLSQSPSVTSVVTATSSPSPTSTKSASGQQSESGRGGNANPMHPDPGDPNGPAVKRHFALSYPKALVVTVTDITTVYESLALSTSTSASTASNSTVSSRTTPASHSSSSGTSISLDPSVVQAVMPSASSCANALFPSECATASEAAPYIAAGWAKYNISSKAAQAATLALMAYESGQLQFNEAHYPPLAGKGTRNMQSPAFNINQYSCASASWFLATQCPAVLQRFGSDADGAWTAYLGSGCVGTADNAQRDAFWASAKLALGVGS